jgi:hydrogenase maturation factor
MTGDCADGHCITCGDVAETMRIVAVDAPRGMALCENEDGERASVEVALVEPVATGEDVLVHAGVALVRL